MTEVLEQQTKVVISLLARSAIGVEHINKIVRSGKKKGKPDDFVLAYNSLDGSKSGAEVAKTVGITQQGMAAVLQTWEEEGIVYKVGKSGRFAGLLKLPLKVKRSVSSTGKGKRKPIMPKKATLNPSPTQPPTEGDPATEA